MPDIHHPCLSMVVISHGASIEVKILAAWRMRVRVRVRARVTCPVGVVVHRQLCVGCHYITLAVVRLGFYLVYYVHWTD